MRADESEMFVEEEPAKPIERSLYQVSWLMAG